MDGLLTACGAPVGYLTSDRSYKNFALSIEFKCGADTNSGVFVRSPQESGGYEVQIWRQQPAGYNTGAIVGTAKTAREHTFKADDWNRYEITANGDHLVVVLNGETTLDIHDTSFAEGQLRLQYQQFPIAFRNIGSGLCPDADSVRRDPHPAQHGLKPRVAPDRLPERLVLVEDRNRLGVDRAVQQIESAIVVAEGDVDAGGKGRPPRIRSRQPFEFRRERQGLGPIALRRDQHGTTEPHVRLGLAAFARPRELGQPFVDRPRAQ